MVNDIVQQIWEQIRIGNSGLWVCTHEPEEVVRRCQWLVTEKKCGLWVWDIADGLLKVEGEIAPVRDQSLRDPIKAVSALRLRPESEQIRVLFLVNYHAFLDVAPVKQNLVNAIIEGKEQSNFSFYVVLSPKSELPVELQHKITVLDHLPPNRAEIEKIGIELNSELLIDPKAIDAVQGLTRGEVEQSFAWGLVRHSDRQAQSCCVNQELLARTLQKHLIEDLWEAKRRVLKQKPFLKLLRGNKGFESLGGLWGVKDFLKRLLTVEPDLPAHGAMLLGPTGTGKSALARCLGFEVGLPVIELDWGACQSKYVGESYHQLRDALNTIDSMGRVILFLDECEKALIGAGGETGDSGVGAQMFGKLLTWLADRHERGSEVFFICTANDISKLPPEFTRAERFDGTFFMDLPDVDERELIWQQYIEHYKLDKECARSLGNELQLPYTGAEIKQVCYLARKLGTSIREATNKVNPVAEVKADSIKQLREHCKGRYFCARTGLRYGLLPEKGLSGPAQRRKLDIGTRENSVPETS